MANQKHKSGLHPRNKHKGQYDFNELLKHNPKLQAFIIKNKQGQQSIDFFDPIAVKMLNKTLLSYYYAIQNWDIPDHYLCPPIPGRADYIHHIADLLAKENDGLIPKGKKIRVLDIGVGANCIYPIIGVKEYAWSFVGVDINKASLQNAHAIVLNNKTLRSNIELRWQEHSEHIFKGIITAKDNFTLSICNPPFHASAEEAKMEALRKLKNLGKKNVIEPTLNFGGQQHELWCKGGELQFLKHMITQSKSVASSVRWFTTLVSKEAHLKPTYKLLKKVGVAYTNTISMGQGNKKSRLLVWSFIPQTMD